MLWVLFIVVSLACIGAWVCICILYIYIIYRYVYIFIMHIYIYIYFVIQKFVVYILSLSLYIYTYICQHGTGCFWNVHFDIFWPNQHPGCKGYSFTNEWSPANITFIACEHFHGSFLSQNNDMELSIVHKFLIYKSPQSLCPKCALTGAQKVLRAIPFVTLCQGRRVAFWYAFDVGRLVPFGMTSIRFIGPCQVCLNQHAHFTSHDLIPSQKV